jgi:hypothetical protein
MYPKFAMFPFPFTQLVSVKTTKIHCMNGQDVGRSRSPGAF